VARYPSLEDLLRDLRQEQDAGRVGPAWGAWTPHELTECRRLAYRIWGNNGVLELLPDKTLGIGFYCDGKGAVPPGKGSKPRATHLVFVGRSHEDLRAQVEFARTVGGKVGNS
jgi:hypothetical protein